MPNNIDFGDWEKEHNKSLKSSTETFLKETTPEMRTAFWFDVYKVNEGKVKSFTPNFDEVKEKTPLERADTPFNAAL